MFMFAQLSWNITAQRWSSSFNNFLSENLINCKTYLIQCLGSGFVGSATFSLPDLDQSDKMSTLKLKKNFLLSKPKSENFNKF